MNTFSKLISGLGVKIVLWLNTRNTTGGENRNT